MELNKMNTKKILGIITFTVVLFVGLQHIDKVMGVVNILIVLLTPFMIGGGIAFILNVPLKFIERILFTSKKNKKSTWIEIIKRPVSILLSICFVIAIIWFVMFMVIPEISRTISILAEGLPVFVKQVQEWSLSMVDKLPELSDQIADFKINWQKIGAEAVAILQSGVTSVVNSTFNVASSVFGVIFNFVLGFIFSIYILLQKEKLSVQGKKVVYAFLPETIADNVVKVAVLSNKTFSSFVSGQCTEAVILGVLCFIGMSIFRFPYALMISVLIGFTALIPVFGGFIGVGIGAFLILVTDPVKAIMFIVFFIVLQQLEGNLIYPRVVGTSIGLPALWVLAAVTLGGSSFGILGMLVGVPLSSVIYNLLRENVYKRLREKKTTIKKIS